MKSISAIIVDDEVNSAKALKSLLANYCPFVQVADMIHSPEEALRILSVGESPDLLFLDIEMPVINGFQLLEKLNHITFDVIFTTAYDQFALQAFRTNAISYLLKPIDSDELIHAVDKVLDRQENSTLQRIKKIEESISQLRNQTPGLLRLAVHTSDGVTFLDADKIIRLEADSNYTHIFLVSGKKLTSAKTLKEYEELLSGSHFFRIHHAHLVNLRFIDRYIKGEGGYVITSDQTTLEVSRRRKAELLEAMTKLS